MLAKAWIYGWGTTALGLVVRASRANKGQQAGPPSSPSLLHTASLSFDDFDFVSDDLDSRYVVKSNAASTSLRSQNRISPYEPMRM